MIRSSAPSWLACVAVTLVASAAVAEPTSNDTKPGPVATGAGHRVVVRTPVEAFATPHAQISQILYLERCTGGCTVTKGPKNDARTMTSTIPDIQTSQIGEFVNAAGQTGAMADAEWNELVQCVKEVYSPFDVQVTDVKPAGGASHHVAIVAGVPGDIGKDNSILGVAPLAGDCSPQDNVISFSFANAHSRTDPQRVYNLCWTAAQESAHAFGLDHSFEFQDGRSACNDPMTYRTDCAGQRFFRNDAAKCGEDRVRMCNCGTNQNSHVKLTNVFGAGQSTIPAPTISVSLPVANTALGQVAGAMAGSKRGVARVELLLNGYEWAEAKGAQFGQNGQPNPSAYTIQVPLASLPPKSKFDLVVRACDDLGLCTDSPVTPTFKGDPNGCSVAESDCLKGQSCDAGKCSWPPATGQIGDACTYPQFCESGICQGTADEQICTQNCVPGSADSCPDGLACVEMTANRGICFFEDSGGCCSVGSDSNAPFAYGGLSLGLLALVFRRRRR